MNNYSKHNNILFLEIDIDPVLDSILCYYQIKDNRLIITIDNNGTIEEKIDYEINLSQSAVKSLFNILKLNQAPTIKKLLETPIKRIYQDYKPMFCYGQFRSSNVFTEKEFNLIVEEFNKEHLTIKKLARENTTPLIKFLEETNLLPIPTGYTTTSWIAKCPNSNGNHFISISTKNDEWGCGYCRKKGEKKDLISWIEQIEQKKRQREDQKQLSNILKNKSNESTIKWWMDRY